jgi:succinyl-CoA synthetase beta subunit
MEIQEVDAKALLSRFGLAIPAGGRATSADGAVGLAKGAGPWMVKAQIRAGGRFKAGGVVLATSPDAVRREATRLLGARLVTAQTGPAGDLVGAVLVEAAEAVTRELYLGLVIDRPAERIAVIGAAAGGTEIEARAVEAPGRIFKIGIDPATGPLPHHTRRIALGLELDGPAAVAIEGLVRTLYQAFLELDATLLEINPLGLTLTGGLVALDVKLALDDNARPRHPDLADLFAGAESDPLQEAARAAGIDFVPLEGTIGCLVNGAGLAMATMDMIALEGGRAANFLDVGGTATREQVATAFRLILADARVEGILVNIFGGILRCDRIAEALVEAARAVDLKLPLVVRLAGTNAQLGRRILAGSGLPIVSADNLGEAARLIVDAVGRHG